MNTPKKNEMMALPCSSAANQPTETPTPAERNANAAAARDRLRQATAEAFSRSTQYRPAQDGMSFPGSGAK